MKELVLVAFVCLPALAQDADPARDRSRKAYQSLRTGDSVGALSAFEDLVRLSPEDASAWKQLGYLYLEFGDPALALEAFERVATLQPADGEVGLQLGYLYRSLGRTQAAAEQMQRLVDGPPSEWADKAAEVLAQGSIDVAPEYVALETAYAALRRNDYDAAIESFRRSLALDPKRPDIKKQLAYALLEAGRTVQAREAFSHAVALDGADEQARLELAFLQHETGLRSEALEGFRALRRAEDAAVRQTADQTSARLEAELEAAIARWEHTLGSAPSNRSVRLELARLYEQYGEPAHAAEQFFAAWRLPGSNPDEILLSLGRARLASGDLLGAHGAWLLAAESKETRIAETARDLLPQRFPWANDFRAALSLDPDRPKLRSQLAYLLLEVGLRDQAREEFGIIVVADPFNYRAAAQLAFLYQDAGEAERAAELLERAQQSDDPELAERSRVTLIGSRDERSRPLREMGERSLQKSYLLDAKRQFAEAYASDPSDYAAALKLGVVHNLMRQDRQAIEWFRIAGQSDDEQISTQALESYRNLSPQFRRATTTVWMLPFYSRRFGTVFGYAQAKTEFRIGQSALKPYVSLRLSGDVRRTTGGASPQLLSENALIAAAGLRFPLGRGLTLWGEAGESIGYVASPVPGAPRVGPDYRGGLSWFRAKGSTLGGEESGRFYEMNLDAVYVSRFNNDLLSYWRFRPGYRLPTFGPLRAQVYLNHNVTLDRSREYWANYVELGPGLRIRVPKIRPPMDFSLDWVRGVHLSNRGNTRRPNYFDLRAGVWYSFSK